MKNCLIGHHSIADWDKTPNAAWVLSATTFISAPTSLRIGGVPCVEEITPFLCRILATRTLPQGRLETYHRSDPVAGNVEIYFRNQAALGTSNYLNTYIVRILQNKWQLISYVAGVYALIDENNMLTDDDVWIRDRVTWWNGLNPHCEPALVVMFERYILGDWQQKGLWLYHDLNLWKDSAINRCGPGALQLDDTFNYIDDTKIFKPS